MHYDVANMNENVQVREKVNVFLPKPKTPWCLVRSKPSKELESEMLRSKGSGREGKFLN